MLDYAKVLYSSTAGQGAAVQSAVFRSQRSLVLEFWRCRQKTAVGGIIILDFRFSSVEDVRGEDQTTMFLI